LELARVPIRVTTPWACLLLWDASPLFAFVLDEEPVASREQLEFFEKNIRPVLVEHCYEHHAADSKFVQGRLRLDHRAGLIKGGENGTAIDLKVPNDSMLIKALRYEEVEMPPKEKISDSIIANFETWITMAAPDPRVADELPTERTMDLEEVRKFCAFQSIANPENPSIENVSWPLGKIDHSNLAKQESAGIKPVADADRYTWL
jgi:hypothetical protein